MIRFLGRRDRSASLYPAAPITRSAVPRRAWITSAASAIVRAWPQYLQLRTAPWRTFTAASCHEETCMLEAGALGDPRSRLVFRTSTFEAAR
jgi:hypothetical protein